MKFSKGNTIWKELWHHLPFTLTASLAAGVLVAIFYLLGNVPSESLFEIMHPAHVLVSAMATSAIYWKYNKSFLKCIFIGIVGAILIGSLSDIILPWIAGNLFSLHTHFHLPIIEKPFLILGVALAGAAIGMKWNLFKVSHSVHVFLSIFASLFYLLAFSININAWIILIFSLIVFLCVFIPCCISDIVFPLWFIRKKH
ncbi:MAG: hypothetical protein KKF50_01415 [Nanoarchaeota archaeon]|nr:hypothetical protein [Nanoarchaeota archaeon]